MERDDESAEKCHLDASYSAVMIIILGLKNVFTVCIEVAALCSILCPALCILPEDAARVSIFSNIIFVIGICNLIQSLMGIQLAIMHTTNFILFCPIIFYLNSESTKCPGIGDLYAMGPYQRKIEWTNRYKTVMGCFVIMGAVQVFGSLKGVHRLLTKIVTPITLLTALIFIPIGFSNNILDKSSQHVTLFLCTILLFGLLAYQFNCFKVQISDIRINLWTLFSTCLTVMLAWLVCHVLTCYDFLSESNPARTDFRNGIFRYVKHSFNIPFFFEYGGPIFTYSSLCTVATLTLFLIPFSVENYKACNKIQGAKAIANIHSGLLVEALCYFLNVIFGSITGFQISYESVNDIIETQIWNPSIVRLSSTILIIIACSTHLCLYMTIIPEPLIGAILCLICFQQLACFVNLFANRVEFSKRSLFIMIISVLTPLIVNHSLPPEQISNTYISKLMIACLTSVVLNAITKDYKHGKDATCLNTMSHRSLRGKVIETYEEEEHVQNECLDRIGQLTCGCLSCLV